MLNSTDAPTPPATQLMEVPSRCDAVPGDPCAMVIFGATGDLTRRLVVPALYNLARTSLLPEHFALIGVGRSELSTESWREQLYAMLKGYVGKAGAEFATQRLEHDCQLGHAESRTPLVFGDRQAVPSELSVR